MRQPVCLLLLLLAALASVEVRAAVPAYDFRIIIDVSDSMNKTDPQNLRVPALKLINSLLPSGSRAGVWIFGKYVEMAVKWGRVDDEWRKQADLGADKIHSNAQLTNIESALKRARVGWDKPEPGTRRILMLLTDGRVEVSADAAKNERSRQKILGESLAALKKAGAEVHSIALSDGADEVLLKRLSLETGGAFAIARTAGELQKAFYRVFERASKPDTVAFDGREIRIDAGIREMTLLIFRRDENRPTILVPPDSPAISAEKPRGSRWRSDRGYDLITVKNPAAGTWRIDAEMDPDNRLMVVADLQLEVGGLPAYSSPRQAHRVTAALFDKNKMLRKNSFLRFVEFDLTHIDADGNEKTYTLAHSDKREDKGQYLYRLEQKLAEGMHSFIVSADSRTFNRSKRLDLQVQWPVEVWIEALTPPGVYELKLRAREEYLKADGLVADVELEAPDGARESLELQTSNGWMRGIVETSQAGLYRAHVRVSAQNHAAEIHDIDLGSFSMPGVYREALAPPVARPETVGQSPAAEENEAGQGIDWRLVGIVVVSVNVGLTLSALGGWLWLRRRNRQSDEQVIEGEEFGA